MSIKEEISKLKITMPADMPQNLVGTDLADKILDVLKSHGVRAGYAHIQGENWPSIKAYASDGYSWFLGDIADNLFDQMKEKDGYLVFIPKDTK